MSELNIESLCCVKLDARYRVIDMVSVSVCIGVSVGVGVGVGVKVGASDSVVLRERLISSNVPIGLIH